MAFNGLTGMAVLHNFLIALAITGVRLNRRYINATIITMCLKNIHFGEGGGVIIVYFHDDGKH